MRHIIYNIVALACLIGAGSMETKGQVYVGYCTDNIATTGIGNSNTEATISCAAAFTSDGLLTNYQSCLLSQVRVGISATEGLTSLKVWVREHLADDNLTELEVPVEELIVGWNTLTLPESITTSAHDTLYCGYDYTQDRKNVKVVSYGGNKNTKNSFWIASNQKWRDYKSSYGPVSIQAGIEPVQEHALRMCDLRLDRRTQRVISQWDNSSTYEPITISGRVQNLGKEPLQNFVVQNTDNGNASDSFLMEVNAPCDFGQYADFAYTLTPNPGVYITTLDIPIEIGISKPNDAADALLIDCKDTLYYDLGDKADLTFSDYYLIEEYTSEQCGYAPIGQQRLREAIEKAHRLNTGAGDNEDWQEGLVGYSTRYIVLSRHEGYGPADPWRAAGSDYDPAIFGPDKLTFAPAMTINRMRKPVSTTMSADSLAQIISSYWNYNEAFTSIEFKDVTFDAQTHKFKASAIVNLATAIFCPEPYITMCVTQDQATSVEQKNYYPELYDGNVQMDLVRCFLQCTTGNGRLFPASDMEDIIAGRQPIGNYVDYNQYGGAYLTLDFEGSLPDDLTTLDGLTLIAYVCDRTAGGHIHGLNYKTLGK